MFGGGAGGGGGGGGVTVAKGAHASETMTSILTQQGEFLVRALEG